MVIYRISPFILSKTFPELLELLVVVMVIPVVPVMPVMPLSPCLHEEF